MWPCDPWTRHPPHTIGCIILPAQPMIMIIIIIIIIIIWYHHMTWCCMQTPCTNRGGGPYLLDLHQILRHQRPRLLLWGLWGILRQQRLRLLLRGGLEAGAGRVVVGVHQ
jgi:hypothetical protein